MNDLPVKLLTELLTPDEMITADNVRSTHDVKFCPIGISLRDEGSVTQCLCGGNEFREFRYTPRAYFAVKVWETARDNLLMRPEFAGALDIEWHPVAASFRSIRFVNGDTEEFIAAMFKEMKRVADSRTIEIRYGRFDAPALPERPNSPCHYYIMPPDVFVSKYGWGLKNELVALQNSPAGPFSWDDIEGAFVVLKPIQLAFIAGDEMNRHTPLDEEFIRACGKFDLGKVKELVEKGANIHAADQYGDTAMSTMMMCYCDLEDVDENGGRHFRNKDHDRFIELAKYLLSLGYNINLAGYAEATCLYEAAHLLGDLEIVKFLLDNGANPNIGSYIGDIGEDVLGHTALLHVWDDERIHDEEDFSVLTKLLLKYGALPVPAGEPLPAGELDEWIKERKADKDWDESVCEGLSKPDAALVYCAQCMKIYHMALIAQNGGDVSVRDERGRNLLQIVLEWEKHDPSDSRQQRLLAEMSLMLLCGLKLKLSDAEIEQAKETCRIKGYQEALDAISSVVDGNER